MFSSAFRNTDFLKAIKPSPYSEPIKSVGTKLSSITNVTGGGDLEGYPYLFHISSNVL